MPCDVIVAGAGPAGSLAAAILARSGARVRLFDRERFPRPKLCGDTLNPGAMRLLDRRVDTADVRRRALPLDGMVLTGPHVAVRGRYAHGQRALALPRRDLDALLLEEALAAGVTFADRALVDAPCVDGDGRVCGVLVKTRGARREERARLVIAADGRASRLARALGLARHARRPRRWAIGGYFEGVAGLSAFGEMHVRSGHYIGVAPMPGGLANTCLVTWHNGDDGWRRPADLLCAAVRRDARLAERFSQARLVDAPLVLGPMAVEANAVGVPGLLLAGDAAGFIDPMTGDGLRFALHGAVLAAGVAGEILGGRLTDASAPAVLAARRRAVFRRKWRFNRAVRALVASPAAVSAAALSAAVVPPLFRAMIRYAGDCE